MHALLLTLGSYGDVHPFIGLGYRLAARGHRVTLAASAPFGPLAEAHGLRFLPLGTVQEYDRLKHDAELWHPRRGGMKVLGVVGQTLRQAYEVLAGQVDEETVIAASTLGLAGRVVHERLGTPMASVHLAPFVFRSLHDPPRLPGMLPLHWMPRFMRRRFWDAADRYVLDPLMARPLNEVRRELGLTEPVTGVLNEWWHAPQRVIGFWPDWFAPPPPDWPGQVRLCGFPLYDERETAEVPPEVEGFLDAGPPPVAFTPGSAMMFGERFFEAAAGACARLGLRGLLLSRSEHHIPRDLPAGVIHVPFAPFSRLLPRCCALVHHGGIGTLSQGMAAGIPQVIMPMAHDQWDNAVRLKRLGVGLTLSPRSFTAARLARLLERLLRSPGSPAIAARCGELAGRIAGVDAIQKACEELEALSPRRPVDHEAATASP